MPSNSSADARAGHHGQHAAAPASPRPAARLRSATCSVMSATSRWETSPSPANSAVARSGSSVCRWTLSVWPSPTTSTESPSSSSGSVHDVGLHPLAGDREVRAVAVGGRLVLRVGDAGRRVVGELRRLRPAQRGDHAREHHGQAVAAGVDDARLAQDRQQLRPARDRQLARAQRRLQHARDHRVLLVVGHLVVQARLVHVRDLGGDPGRHLAHDGEDRALGRLAHGAVRAVGGAGHRGGDQHRVDQLAGARDQLLGGAAQELGEDHARVAARAEQRGAGDGVHELVAADVVDVALRRQAVQLVEHGAQGERHVVPGVAVGDREHVEVVDLAAAGLELEQRAFDDSAKPYEAGICHGR